MGKRGVLMRKHEDADTGMTELLGHVIGAVAGTLSVTPARAWRLRDALLRAFRLRKLSGSPWECCWDRRQR